MIMKDHITQQNKNLTRSPQKIVGVNQEKIAEEADILVPRKEKVPQFNVYDGSVVTTKPIDENGEFLELFSTAWARDNIDAVT